MSLVLAAFVQFAGLRDGRNHMKRIMDKTLAKRGRIPTGIVGALLLALLLGACSGKPPVERLKQDLAQYPEYSIILNDMKTEGNFFTEYLHQYKLIWAERNADTDSLSFNTEITNWMEVSSEEYKKYESNLGMALATRTANGEVKATAQPPGYQYVGNQNYGRWAHSPSGGSFWQFYGQYAFMSAMFNMARGPIGMNDYNSYRNNIDSRRPYYGSNKQYGTNGTHTKQSNKSFFQRKVARERASKARFSDKVRSRASRSGRSSGSRFRSRSSRGGK